jgi:hypothetical protein
MQVVDVERVDAQSPQARLRTPRDGRAGQRRGATGLVAGHADLGRDGEAARVARDQLADHALGRATRVHVRGVQHGDARVGGDVQHPACCLDVDLGSEGHRAEHEAGHGLGHRVPRSGQRAEIVLGGYRLSFNSTSRGPFAPSAVPSASASPSSVDSTAGMPNAAASARKSGRTRSTPRWALPVWSWSKRSADLGGVLVGGVDAARARLGDLEAGQQPPRPRGHDQHAVAQEQRLRDAVRHEQHGFAVLHEDRLQFNGEPVAGERVERGERLVHQQQLRVVQQRAGDRHPLLHATGEFGRVVLGEIGEADRFQQAVRAFELAALPSDSSRLLVLRRSSGSKC